ncbi:YkvA family protein [Shewanella sp. 0m-4]
MFSKAMDKLKASKDKPETDTVSEKEELKNKVALEEAQEKNNEDYSEEGFWDKCKNYATSIGKAGLEKAFTLYYATEHKDCTLVHKTAIYGALGYLISPIDAIPDLTPFLGYTDDVGLIGAALVAVSSCIDEGVISKAQEKVKDIFG